MVWAISEYSKKVVMRAGETLIDELSTEDEISKAMDILSNWRAAHAYPMHSVLMTLRGQVKNVDEKAVVVQRLKRTPSIFGKLKRFPDMKLHRMQDISGCRAILNLVRDVERLDVQIRESRTQHKLHNFHNYIAEPKASGYRGIHLVYKYNGKKVEYQDYFVEIQLRSKIQHAWATAVEIVDTFTKQALKTSRGNQDWLDFFIYASAEFAKLEKRPIGPIPEGIDSLVEAKRLAKKLNVIVKLNAFAVTADYITKKHDGKTDYFLLELTDHATKIQVSQYPTARFDAATKAYAEREKQAKVDLTYDVVLVAASSMHALKSAYPNYFADSKDFLKYIRRVIEPAIG